jgi:hypothetical protein
MADMTFGMVRPMIVVASAMREMASSMEVAPMAEVAEVATEMATHMAAKMPAEMAATEPYGDHGTVCV